LPAVAAGPTIQGMRPSRLVLAVTAALLAGCSGGHSGAAGTSTRAPQPPGIYVARVTVHPRVPSDTILPSSLTVWLDTATGRFRIATPISATASTVSVYDGRRATSAFGAGRDRRVWAYRGSAAFIARRLGYVPLAALHAFLTGSRPSAGVAIEVRGHGPPAVIATSTRYQRLTLSLRRLASAPPGLFRTSRAPVIVTTRQVAPGTQPPAGVPAYWVGASFRGRPAAEASESVGRTGSGASVSYPGLDIDTSGRLGSLTGGRSVTLRDGTRASVTVVPIAADGSYRLEGSGSGGSFDHLVGVVQPPDAGRDIALVTLPHALVTLSGSAVTRRSAAAIARALRPL
jgi:hypothetical protein